jgi:mRNA-degrading endonuclease RelE of RelBE toxin-antitoxin system
MRSNGRAALCARCVRYPQMWACTWQKRSAGWLAEVPRPPGCKKLIGFKDLWRIRIGTYRVIYSVSDVVQLVRIERVSHRKDAYR